MINLREREREREGGGGRFLLSWAKAEKDSEKGRKAKVTTLRRVQLARSCAMWGEVVVGEVNCFDGAVLKRLSDCWWAL